MVKDVVPLPGYPEPYGLLCAILEDTTSEWRAELPGDLGEDVTTWRVRPGGQTIGAIMLHMIMVEILWIERVVLGRPTDEIEAQTLMRDEIDVDAGLWPDPPRQPLSWYLALHDTVRGRMLAAIKEWPPADSPIGDESNDYRDTPRWILGHVIQHEAYHGGQILLMHDLWLHRS